MIERLIDLWLEPCDARCITTNGFLKKDGSLVMGRGVASQAKYRYPSIPYAWGEWVQKNGNHVQAIAFPKDDKIETLISFPVKHNWWEQADLQLIERSARELMEIMHGREKVLLPRPGCGNGQLNWQDVKPVLEPILDDRVWVITNLTEDFNAAT